MLLLAKEEEEVGRSKDGDERFGNLEMGAGGGENYPFFHFLFLGYRVYVQVNLE